MRTRICIALATLTFCVTELFAQGPLDSRQIRYEYFSHPSSYFGMWAELNSDMQIDGERILHNYESGDSTMVARLHYRRNWLVDTAIINAPDVQLNAFFVLPEGNDYRAIEIPELHEKGVPQGLFTRASLLEGIIVSSEKFTYHQGTKNGPCVEFSLRDISDRSTGLWKYYNMTEDVLDGYYLMKYEAGDTLEYGLYSAGMKEGCWQTLRYDGAKILTCYQNNLRHGDYKVWHKNGTREVEAHYVNDLRDGWNRTWYQNGQMSSEGFFRKGKINGTFRNWYSDGKLQQLSQYDSLGNFHGVDEWYHENGQLAYRQHFVHGQLEGLSEIWNYKGVLTERAHYHENAREGKTETFYASGKLYQERYYHGDELNGTDKAWDENGKLIRYLVYKNGVRVKSYVDLLKEDEELVDRNVGIMGVGMADGEDEEILSDFSHRVFRIGYYKNTLKCLSEYSRALSDSLNVYYQQLSKGKQKRWKNIRQLEVTVQGYKSNVAVITLSGADEALNAELLAYLQRVMKSKSCYIYTTTRLKLMIPFKVDTQKH